MNDLNVLVLEDEPFQRLVAVTALKKVVPGSILEAADGKEAVAILESCGHVDIAICDLQMSGMDGLAFLRHASLSGKVHSVILSSEVDPILRQATISMIECLGLNFLGDLGKPFSLERITALLTRYNARRQDLPRQIEVAELPSVADVVRGLDNGEFEAYYQPKVALDGGGLIGAIQGHLGLVASPGVAPSSAVSWRWRRRWEFPWWWKGWRATNNGYA